MENQEMNQAVELKPVENQEVTAEQKAPAAPEARKFKIALENGAEAELPEEEVLNLAKMGQYAQSKLNEAAGAKKQAEEFFELLKSNPKKALSDPKFGLDLRKFSEETLAEMLQEELLSPEQRKIKEYEAKLREVEDQKKAEAEAKNKAEMEKLQASYAKQFETSFSEALNSSGLPKTAKTVRRIAELMYQNLESGYDLEPKDLVPIVKQEYIDEIKELFGAADASSILALIGDDVGKKIRQADLNRVKNSAPAFSPKAETKVPIKNETKPLSKAEWKAMLANISD
jgi:hypothetical protein